jgi:hypothetical protein
MSAISKCLLVASWATLAACGGDLALPGDGSPGDGGSPTGPETSSLVNVSPSFTPGADQEVKREKHERDAKVQEVDGWARNITPGPADEAAQSVEFMVDVVSGGESLAATPSISPSGTLRYQPSDEDGTVRLEVRLHDDGGTANGGTDTSQPHTLIITVTR